MGTDNNLIQNVRTPFRDEDASNKKYIDNTLSQSYLLPSQKNVFKYLIDQNESSSDYNIVVNGIL